MLLVAIPKSASTSLMHTLGTTHNLKYTMHFEWDGSLCSGHKAYHQQHNFGWELNERIVDFWRTSDILFKVHVFPSENNRQLLRDVKKVVLLRKPVDIVQAYRRGHETGVYRSRLNVFHGCVSPEEWHEKALASGLLGSLKYFYNAWKAEKQNVLHIEFDDLVQDTASTVRKIEHFWSLPESKIHSLYKRKFSRQDETVVDVLRFYNKQEEEDKNNTLFIKGRWKIEE